MPALAGEPAPWLIVDAAGTVLERGLLSARVRPETGARSSV